MSKVCPLLFAGRRSSFFLYQQLIFCIFSLLVGCASFAPATVVNTVVIEPEVGATPVNFELMGRISAKDGKQGFSGGVRWLHTNADDEIHLLSPFGQIVAQIRRNQDVVLLTTSEQKIYRAANVEDLTKKILGWRLPPLGFAILGARREFAYNEIGDGYGYRRACNGYPTGRMGNCIFKLFSITIHTSCTS